MFATSNHTLKDLQFCLERRNHIVPARTLLPPGGNGGMPATPLSRPVAMPYVLMVGTIEARKNHGGMLRVWRHLVNNPPANGVPLLVFAGIAGWLMDDLMQQLKTPLISTARFYSSTSHLKPSWRRYISIASLRFTLRFMRAGVYRSRNHFATANLSWRRTVPPSLKPAAPIAVISTPTT